MTVWKAILLVGFGLVGVTSYVLIGRGELAPKYTRRSWFQFDRRLLIVLSGLVSLFGVAYLVAAATGHG
jgi:hypothetical protein